VHARACAGAAQVGRPHLQPSITHPRALDITTSAILMHTYARCRTYKCHGMATAAITTIDCCAHTREVSIMHALVCSSLAATCTDRTDLTSLAHLHTHTYLDALSASLSRDARFNVRSHVYFDLDALLSSSRFSRTCISSCSCAQGATTTLSRRLWGMPTMCTT